MDIYADQKDASSQFQKVRKLLTKAVTPVLPLLTFPPLIAIANGMNCFDNATVAYFEFTDNSRHSFTILTTLQYARRGLESR